MTACDPDKGCGTGKVAVQSTFLDPVGDARARCVRTLRGLAKASMVLQAHATAAERALADYARAIEEELAGTDIDLIAEVDGPVDAEIEAELNALAKASKPPE